MDWELKHYSMYRKGVKMVYPNIPPGGPIYSKSVVVGNLVFVSGCEALNPATGNIETNVFEEQMTIALDKVREAMEEAGSSMENVIKTLMLLTNLEDYPRMRKMELEYYQKHAPFLAENPPASTFIQIPALGRPELLIEIEVIGVISRDKAGWEVTQYPMYYDGIKLAYPNVKPGAPFFSKSAVVGNLIFLSGMAGRPLKGGDIPPPTFEEQMTIALDKVREAMEEAGSSMENVIKTLMLLTNLEDYPRMRKMELEYYQKHAPFLAENPPASTFIQVAFLAKPGYRVEIDATGFVSRDKPGWEVVIYPEYWRGKKLAYPYVAPEAPKFARTAVVGNLVFFSGCEALNPETGKTETDVFEEQMLICLDKVKMGLEEMGSSMSNLIKTCILFTDMKDYSTMRRVELEYYQKYAPRLIEKPPASTVMQVASLTKPQFLIEIDAMAALPGDK
jgi:2-iminobutanoate/2-iminopropanoate deaminase